MPTTFINASTLSNSNINNNIAYSNPNIDNSILLYGGPKVFANTRTEIEKYNLDNYNYKTIFYNIIKKYDTNNNLIDDRLEKIINTNIYKKIKVIIIYDVDPSKLYYYQGIRELVKHINIINSLNGSVYDGPWYNVIVGFAAEIPAKVVYSLPNILKSDIDGDNILDNIFIVQDHFNYTLALYWTSKQLNIRPIVWNPLNVTGKNVTVFLIDTGIDGSNTFFNEKIIYWRDLVGDSSGTIHNIPYDDNLHGTHLASLIAGSSPPYPDNNVHFVFGISDYTIPISGWIILNPTLFYVNTTGSINLMFKWKPDPNGSINTIGLVYCPYMLALESCTFTLADIIDTPTPGSWYRLTYYINSPSQFGTYGLAVNIKDGNGIAMLTLIDMPIQQDASDMFSKFTGMAPQASIGVIKAFQYDGYSTTSKIISALDIISSIRNKLEPPIYVVTLGFGGPYDPALENAVTNLANQGLVIVAAGNNGGPLDNVGSYTPSSNPFVITVGSVDALNNVTDYSSAGGASNYNNSVIKPDIVAPGGGLYIYIEGADTSWHDDMSNYIITSNGTSLEDIDWLDQVNSHNAGYDDLVLLSGTSVSTAVVSGVAALVVDALVNNASIKWSWDSFLTARLVKNILLISTYETYPLLRETYSRDLSPSLDKGAKDVHEGYGMIDAQAAVLIALSMAKDRALLPGSIISGIFRPGVLYGARLDSGVWNNPFGSSVWGSRVFFPFTKFTLVNGTTYNVKYSFKLIMHPDSPQSSSKIDLDLYLYDILGNMYGEPIILASSTNPRGIIEEYISIYPPLSGQAIVTVKRATEDSPGGKWTLFIGPHINIYTQSGSNVAYLGEEITISIKSARATKAELIIYDNTTGNIIDVIQTTLIQDHLYSYSNITWVIPNNPNLNNHTLIIITKLYDNGGNLESGPYPVTLNVLSKSSPPHVEITPKITPPINIIAYINNFPSNSKVDVYIRHPTGNLEWLASTTTDNTGSATMIIGLPRTLAPGAYQLVFYSNGVNILSKEVIITKPIITINNTSVSPGDYVHILIQNLDINTSQLYAIKIGEIVTDIVNSDLNGVIETTIKIPPLKNGYYKIKLVYLDTYIKRNNIKYAGSTELASINVYVFNGIITENNITNIYNKIALLESKINELYKSINNIINT